MIGLFCSPAPDVSDEAVVAGTLLPPPEEERLHLSSAHMDQPTHVSQYITVCASYKHTEL